MKKTKEQKPEVTAGAPAQQAGQAPQVQSIEVKEEIVQCDTWRFHNEHQPKIFRKGETIPADWHKDRSKLSVIWMCDAFGGWTSKKK